MALHVCACVHVCAEGMQEAMVPDLRFLVLCRWKGFREWGGKAKAAVCQGHDV